MQGAAAAWLTVPPIPGGFRHLPSEFWSFRQGVRVEALCPTSPRALMHHPLGEPEEKGDPVNEVLQIHGDVRPSLLVWGCFLREKQRQVVLMVTLRLPSVPFQETCLSPPSASLPRCLSSTGCFYIVFFLEAFAVDINNQNKSEASPELLFFQVYKEPRNSPWQEMPLRTRTSDLAHIPE